MAARLVEDLSAAIKHLGNAEDRTLAALNLVDPVSKRLSDEVASAVKAVEHAHDRVARAVAALDGSGL